METLIEDKFVTSSTRGESGASCETETTQEPCQGMIFDSEQAAKAFYDDYARQVGFFTRIVSSQKSERDGSIISRRLACNKEGFNLSSKTGGKIRIRKQESKREGCMAMIVVKREKPGQWIVTKFVKDHNHPLLVSSTNGGQTSDDKDMKIKELSSELHHANQFLDTCREQLRVLMTYIEEHIGCLSRTVENAVQNIREIESKNQTEQQ
ncbi:protein FAR1-RELATED SEQUENCE 5-like [Carica papaya]|uniref:protein FAR1-RELATED SEQUENCE 5-like n=1 Tax=Carica papaya TaxID=3649 RepID=UPI000B8C911D|nr:protein FAR1-RELATED SEQUENCE 5-like [Carica papaya]